MINEDAVRTGQTRQVEFIHDRLVAGGVSSTKGQVMAPTKLDSTARTSNPQAPPAGYSRKGDSILISTAQKLRPRSTRWCAIIVEMYRGHGRALIQGRYPRLAPSTFRVPKTKHSDGIRGPGWRLALRPDHPRCPGRGLFWIRAQSFGGEFENAPLTESSFPLFIGPEDVNRTLIPHPEPGSKSLNPRITIIFFFNIGHGGGLPGVDYVPGMLARLQVARQATVSTMRRTRQHLHRAGESLVQIYFQRLTTWKIRTLSRLRCCSRGQGVR